jgi:ribosomal protein S18 acetylase RimI-like enzyme
MKIKRAKEKEDFLSCWEVIHQLHPDLDQDRYLTLMLYMIDEGYKLIYVEENGKGLSCCGYRITTMLHRGRSIYIDDLCTLPEFRGRGYAKALLNCVLKEAREEEVQSIHLDSNHQRHSAHRLYLNFGFNITSLHFAMELKNSVELQSIQATDGVKNKNSAAA